MRPHLACSFPGLPGPAASPQLELFSEAGATRNSCRQDRLHMESWELGCLGLGCPPPRLRPPNPACPRPTLHLSHIISKAMHPSPANSVLKDFIFPLPNPLSSGHELPQSKGSKMCGQKQKHFHQTQEQEHLPASMGRVGQGEHSDRALGKKELGILLICQQVSGRHHGAQMGAWEVL